MKEWLEWKITLTNVVCHSLFCIKNVLTFLIWSNSSEKTSIFSFYLEITCARKFPSVQVYPPISNLAQFCLKPMFSYVVSCHYCPLSFNSLVSAGCADCGPNCQLLRVSTEFKKITDLKIGIGPWINPWKRRQYSKLEGKLAQMGISWNKLSLV